MGFWISVVILMALIAVWAWQGLQMKALANSGVLGRGEVIQKIRLHISTGHQTAGYLKYRFLAPDGKALTGRIAVSEKIYTEYDEGEPIDIVYLPERPRVNAARYVVNLSRKALNLSPL